MPIMFCFESPHKRYLEHKASPSEIATVLFYHSSVLGSKETLSN